MELRKSERKQAKIKLALQGSAGSGKTYTMNGLQDIAVKDLFERGIDYWENHKRNFTVTVSDVRP